ncbi:NfeD family protein [Allosphingosinicella sp.]|jgi:hypothetical protein|uniref:NfeD family protein n=1 Tax=Allosphingosinicella sp. TaxID=2823234 RepID=UPI002F167C49
MSGLEAHWWWLLAAALLALLEIVLPGVFSIWIAAAAGATALLVLGFNPPFPFQLVLFALLALVFVYGGRRWYDRNPVDSSDPMLNDRTARLVGRTVEVVSPISESGGRVRVGDSVWEARGPEAPAGAMVRVVAADGGCLRVEAPPSPIEAPDKLLP